MSLISLKSPPNIAKIGSSLKLLLKRHWLSLTITSLLSGLLLTLPSVFYLFNLQVDQFVSNANDQQEITVFLPPNITTQQSDETLNSIRSLTHVKQAALVDSDQALKSIQHIEGINAAIHALGGINPLHHTIIITPTKILTHQELQTLTSSLEQLPHISDIAVDEQWIIFINRVSKKLGNFLTTFVLICLFISSTLIFYFMLVRCMTTQAEMKLKFYLGAYPWQIYQPYMGFGLVIGAISGLIAMLLTSLSYYLYNTIWQNTIVGELIYQPTISMKILGYLFIASLLFSFISSTIATYMVHKNILKDYFIH